MSSSTPLSVSQHQESNQRVGKQIRDLRKSKGITQAFLAEKTGRSLGYISQLERGLSSVSIPVLQQISEVLGVNIAWFFHLENETAPDEGNFVVRRDNRRQMSFSDGGIKDELLSPWMSGDFLMLLTTIAPGAETDKKPRERKGDEGGYILSGQVEFTIGKQHMILNPGDSFFFGENEYFQFRNLSEAQEVVIVWVMSPSSF